MAIKVNFNGVEIRKPGVYTRATVNLVGGFPVADTGIVGIVGEAEGGAPGSIDDIRENFFSPEQVDEVVSKYREGPIVDAFKILASPSNDGRIPNGAQRVYIYKTNQSVLASGALATGYGTVYSRNYGKDENTISFQVEQSQLEVGPTKTFNFITDETLAGALSIRANGLVKQDLAIAATKTPAGFVTDFAALTDVSASGGTDRLIVTAPMTGVESLAIAFAGAGYGLATITCSGGTFDAIPTVGDTLYIPAASILQGAGANVGGYLVVSASATVITAYKLADPTQAGLDVVATLVAAAIDLQAFAPVTISYDGTTLAGMSAALEVMDDGGALALEELIYGGTDLGVLTSTQVIDGSKLSLTASGSDVEVEIDTVFAALAEVGDIMTILPGSIIAGALNVNVGNYLVTAATTTKISATKFSGAPATVAATDIVALTDLEVFEGFMSVSSTAPRVIGSSAEEKIIIGLDKTATSESEDSDALGGNIMMKIGYDGTTAVMSINSVNLTTTVVGGSGANLTIKLADYNTIQALVNFIATQTGYSAAVGNNVYASLPPSYLDRVTAVGICEEFAGSLPGLIKRDSKDVQDFFELSELCSLTRILYAGLPTVAASATYLTNGAKGGSSGANVVAGIDEMEKVRINSLVPLFSRDATDDILDELTESSSTYQISAINAAAKTHEILMSSTKKRSYRNAYPSFKGTLAATKIEAQTLAAFRCSLTLQDIKILKTSGDLEWIQPWGMACIAAGMQAGAPVGEPMTFKFINVSGIRHADFDPATEYDEAIDAGLLFAEQPSQGGFRIVVGNTTYGTDANFVYNRISVIYAADTVQYNLIQQLESIYIGVNSAVANAATIKNTVIALMGTFLAAGILKGDDSNNGKGYKNLSVSIAGNVITVKITITPAQGVDFLLNDIVLDTIRESSV